MGRSSNYLFPFLKHEQGYKGIIPTWIQTQEKRRTFALQPKAAASSASAVRRRALGTPPVSGPTIKLLFYIGQTPFAYFTSPSPFPLLLIGTSSQFVLLGKLKECSRNNEIYSDKEKKKKIGSRYFPFPPLPLLPLPFPKARTPHQGYPKQGNEGQNRLTRLMVLLSYLFVCLFDVNIFAYGRNNTREKRNRCG